MSFTDFAALFLETCISVALVLLGLAFAMTIARIVKGPTLPDRVLGLDMLTGVAIGFIAVIGIDTGFTLYVDIAIALGLVGFLATIAFARFILARGKAEDDPIANASPAGDGDGRPAAETGRGRR